MMLQGLTVQYLFRRTYPLKAGDTILFHAAAGGVGLIACQWARAMGVNLIGTVGSNEKAALAKSHGAAHVINYNTEDVVQRVLEITKGEKVPVVYDSVGKDTFTRSLDCLQPLGLMVSFGNSSGAGAAVRAERAGLARLAVHHAPDAADLCRQARRPGSDGGRPVRDGHQRQGQDRDPPALPAGGRGPGPHRAGIAAHHR
jgi:NADPH:quinone reductase-like Zn-dependent oxidoreductase